MITRRGGAGSSCRCPRGAGRVMSRGQAKKLISLDDHKAAMKGIECRVDVGVLDESPAAYKDIGAVMDAQTDLVAIRHRLRQVVNVKGGLPPGRGPRAPSAPLPPRRAP